MLRSHLVRGLVIGSALLVGTCTSSPSGSPSTGAGKGGSGGSASSGGSSGSGGGGAGAGGAVATGGSGGGAAAGAGGNSGGSGAGGATATGGTGGAAPGGVDAASDSAGAADTAGGSSTMGTQGDPGILGDGNEMHAPPYMLPPESTMLVNGAPKGQLLGPMIHTQTGTYTGWGNWKFTYWIYVPAQYKPGKAAALMVLNDGLLYTGQASVAAKFNAPMVFDNLIAEGAMPVTIGVLVEPGTSDGRHVGGGDPGRSRQYDTANDQYGKFLINEFLPAVIGGKYDIVTDPDGWGTGGHSSGGIAAFTTAWFYPDKFRKVVSASPSFPNQGLFPAEILKVTPPKPIRVFHMAGTMDLGGWYASNNQAAANFKQMGYHYRYRPANDIHYPPAAAAADFPNALRWLWRAYKGPQ